MEGTDNVGGIPLMPMVARNLNGGGALRAKGGGGVVMFQETMRHEDKYLLTQPTWAERGRTNEKYGMAGWNHLTTCSCLP